MSKFKNLQIDQTNYEYTKLSLKQVKGLIYAQGTYWDYSSETPEKATLIQLKQLGLVSYNECWCLTELGFQALIQYYPSLTIDPPNVIRVNFQTKKKGGIVW